MNAVLFYWLLLYLFYVWVCACYADTECNMYAIVILNYSWGTAIDPFNDFLFIISCPFCNQHKTSYNIKEHVILLLNY